MAVISVFKWLLKYMWQHPWMTLLTILGGIFEPGFYMIPLFISADIVGVLNSGGTWGDILAYFKILIPLAITQVLLFFFVSYINEILAHRISTDMTYDLFDTLQHRSLTYHDGKDTGEIMARATNDTRAVNMGLNPGIRMNIATLVIWVVSAFVVATVQPIFGVLTVIAMIVFLILTFIYALWVNPVSTQVLEELSELSAITNDSLTGIRDIKSYAAESIFTDKFSKQAVKYAQKKEYEGQIGAWFLPDAFSRIFVLSVIAYALFQTFTGAMSIRDLVLITTIFSLVGGMSEEMGWVSFITVAMYSAATRLHDFMHEPDPAATTDGEILFHNLPATIDFQHVYFSYDKGYVLEDITFTLKDSETLAIVGGPGSGKSTLTKLIQRLYTPTEGAILLGGYNLFEFSNTSLRKEISTVEQEIHLFNDTILENIRFGRPTASFDEVVEVSKIAHAHDFIESFTDGYETVIGDQGVRLSGGQAQRLAIARAILVNPAILIFDDGASALDANTEFRIQEAISDILNTRTTIITTHRLAIIAKADKILMLNKGRMIGFGSHAELIRSNIYYRQLFERHYVLPPLVKV